MKFILPQGIGDAVWALFKIQSIRDALDPGGTIDVHIACSATSTLESRALDFVRRFTFVDSAQMFVCGGLGNTPPVRPDGCYNYIEDGWYDYDGDRYCVLIPNETLERGVRLEDWLPHYAIDWTIFSKFRITNGERMLADRIHAKLGDYCVFYPGPLMGNTTNGHNRGGLWRPADWVELGCRVGLPVVLVGAPYDAAYYDQLLGPALNGDASRYTNLIGQTSLGELYSVTSRAKFVVSYQAGVGIVSAYMKTPTAIWWRPQGDSISPDFYLSFDERMAAAWASPEILERGTYFPMIYGKHGIDEVMKWARRWAQCRDWTTSQDGVSIG